MVWYVSLHLLLLDSSSYAEAAMKVGEDSSREVLKSVQENEQASLQTGKIPMCTARRTVTQVCVCFQFILETFWEVVFSYPALATQRE